MVELKNISKSYNGKLIFSNLSLSIQKNSITLLHGKSGIGKTTLLKCLCLLEPLDNGTILINNKNVSFETDKKSIVFRQQVGIVFQDIYLWTHKTILRNLTEAPVNVIKINKRVAAKQAREFTRTFSLNSDLLNRYPNDLSRGERQRFAIIRTLLMNPELIILDEPTSSLDPNSIKQIVVIIKKLQQLGKTILIVSHDTWLKEKFSNNAISFESLL